MVIFHSYVKLPEGTQPLGQVSDAQKAAKGCPGISWTRGTESFQNDDLKL